MRIKHLPLEERAALDTAFRSSKNQKEANRIQVIRLLAKGYSHAQVSEITGKSPVTIEVLVTTYGKQGVKGLQLKPHPRNNAVLTIKQKERIKQILATHETPSHAGMKVSPDEDYWSLRSVKQLVTERFHVEYKHQDSYRRLLRYCGYSYQRVEFEDERRSNEKAEDFKKRATIKLKKGTMSMSW